MTVPILDIFRGTPVWVFALFAYLLWMGISRLKPRVRPFGQIWITPAVFIAWGLLGLFEHTGSIAPTLSRWLIAAAVGGVLGAAGGAPLKVDRARNLVQLPASVMPLVRNAAIFGAHYVLRVAATMNPPVHDMLMGWDTCVSGASAGYFLGWAVQCLRSYRNAQHVDLDLTEPAVAAGSR